MFLIDVSTPLTIIIAIVLTLCVLLLARETKNSTLVAIILGIFIALLVVHTIQLTTLSESYLYLMNTLRRCLIVDFIFILLNYISYLWIDEIEAKYKNKKNIDNSLNWFWKKI